MLSAKCHGAGQGSVNAGMAQSLELPASRTELVAGNASASRISLRRGPRVVIALITNGGIATAN